MHIFKIGELVYYDSMAGLVKGKIINIEWPNSGMVITPNSRKFTMKVTSRTHKVYKLGELIESSRLWIIPRNAVYISSGQYRIRPY